MTSRSERRMSFRALDRAAAILCLVLIGLATPSFAAIKGAVKGAQPRGYARLVFTFDAPIQARTRISNGILIIDFPEPVTLAPEKLAAEMPDYVSVVRVDPDGKSMRLALVQPARPNMMEAGERLFIDLLPPTWRGVPPGLPQDVVDELAQRARAAETQLRKIEQANVKPQPTEVEVRVGELPTLTRLVFAPPRTVPISFMEEEGKAELTFDAALTIDETKLRQLLPSTIADGTIEAGAALKLTFKLADGVDIVGFREDDNYVLDITKPKPKAQPKDKAEARDMKASPKKEEQAKAAKMDAAKTEPAKVEQAAMSDAAKPGSSSGMAAIALTPVEPVPSDAAQNQTNVQKLIQMSPVVPVTGDKGGDLTIRFPFAARTAAAAFQRDGAVIVMFEGPEKLDIEPLKQNTGPLVLTAFQRDGAVSTMRFNVAHPGLLGLVPQGQTWELTYGDHAGSVNTPLTLTRTLDKGGRNLVEADLTEIGGIHWMMGPAGDRIAVATAFAPTRGLPKDQRFVEFAALSSAQGLAIAAIADDVVVTPGIGKVLIGRRSGLTMSLAAPDDGILRADTPEALVIDQDEWRKNRAGVTRERGRELEMAAAAARQADKTKARAVYARFLLANRLGREASGVLNVIATDDPQAALEKPIALLRAVAAFQLHHDKDAHDILDMPALADDAEAALWRAAVDARLRRWPHALAGFRRTTDILTAYPDDLQRELRALSARAALAQKDFALAESEVKALAALDPSETGEAALLRARFDDLSAHDDDALKAYDRIAKGGARPLAAEAELYGTELALKTKAITPEEAVQRFETLAMVWRRGHIEAQTLAQLGPLYADLGQWRQAFSIARMADAYLTDYPATQKLHEATAQKFEDLFLHGHGDSLGRLEALALYYDFKEFTPAGRRGDEMIRRLADRLIALDLLEQAGDLLQHQIDHRLSGAARAAVAAKLAMLRLMTNKPELALSVLQSTRLPELPRDIRRARILLEARALSDMSRTDLALDIVTDEKGPEIDRLRADILWQGRRWQQAGEAQELILGDAWQSKEPLSARQRTDVLRAAIAYVLGNEALGLDRLRSKFAAKMADSVDARTFAFLTGKADPASRTFRDVASTVTSADTLSDFLDAYRKRYPDTSVAAPPRRPVPAKPPGEAQAEPPPARG